MSLYIFDTDHMSLLERLDSEAGYHINTRLDQRIGAADKVMTTIITFEEQMRGWMARLAKAKNLSQQIEDYRKLNLMLDNYRSIQVLDFDEKSALQYQALVKARLRVGTMDLKIAAAVLANDAILLTRNQRDFGQVPGLRIEDWAA
jgi:tRNA(fMet)-specific endonuclease VapC